MLRRLEAILFWLVVAGLAGFVAMVLFARFGVPTPPMRGFGEALAKPVDAQRTYSDNVAPFTIVTRVLQSSRCVNCHPVGDRPLRPDGPGFHAMNISRLSVENGMACKTCHKEQNSEFVGVDNGPPGAPHWGLPPGDTPMTFEGRSERALCEQLKRRRATGGRNLPAMLKHVREDPLVLWAWTPGGDRTPPPYSHEEFVAAFSTWVKSGASCAGTRTESP